MSAHAQLDGQGLKAQARAQADGPKPAQTPPQAHDAISCRCLRAPYIGAKSNSLRRLALTQQSARQPLDHGRLRITI